MKLRYQDLKDVAYYAKDGDHMAEIFAKMQGKENPKVTKCREAIRKRKELKKKGLLPPE